LFLDRKTPRDTFSAPKIHNKHILLIEKSTKTKGRPRKIQKTAEKGIGMRMIKKSPLSPFYIAPAQK
jgi:hypothetical protein